MGCRWSHSNQELCHRHGKNENSSASRCGILNFCLTEIPSLGLFWKHFRLRRYANCPSVLLNPLKDTLCPSNPLLSFEGLFLDFCSKTLALSEAFIDPAFHFLFQFFKRGFLMSNFFWWTVSQKRGLVLSDFLFFQFFKTVFKSFKNCPLGCPLI